LITSVKKINNCSLHHFYKFDEKRARTPRWVNNSPLCYSIVVLITHNSPLCYSIVVLITHNSPLCYSIVVLITHNSPLFYSIVVLITHNSNNNAVT
jgi:hypothetical protein